MHLRIGATPILFVRRADAGLAPLRPADKLTPKAGHTIDARRLNLATPQQTAPVGWEPELAELRARIALAKEMGGADRVARQHAGGRLTVRERIDRMLDPGSFHEIGATAGKATYDADSRQIIAFMPANCVFGRGTVDGRPVAIAGDDFTLRGGSADASIKGKPKMSEQIAAEFRMPIIRLIEGSGGGGSVKTIETTGRANLPGGLSETTSFDLVANNMGTVPVVALGLGSVAGLGAARLAASHYSVMVKEMSAVFVAGPPVVERLGEPRSKQELGGWDVQLACGAVDHAVDTEDEAFDAARRFLSYLPGSIWDVPPRVRNWDDPERRDEFLIAAIPRVKKQAYHMRRIIEALVDKGSFFEMGRLFGRPIITGFCRLDGWPVALMAGDPLFHGGAWTADACNKIIRFVDMAQTFHLPIVHLVDCPGLPGRTGGREQRGDPLGRARAGGDQPDHRAVVQHRRAQLLWRRRAGPPAGEPSLRALCLALGKLGVAAAGGRHRGGVSRRDRRRTGSAGEDGRDRGRG